MTTAAITDIQRVTASNLSRNVTLSRSVGWQDVESEWRVLHAGLCATEQGRALYRSRGYEVTGELVISFGGADPEKLRAATLDTVAPLLEVERAVEQDERLSSCDRTAMLLGAVARPARLDVAEP